MGLIPPIIPFSPLKKFRTPAKVLKSMKVKIKRIDKSLPLPRYHSPGAVAFDVYARLKITVEPHSICRIPTNIIIEIPKGYMLLLKDRSSTPGQKGLLNTIGYIDQDFCGDDDEIQLQFYNFQSNPVIIEKGERIGQAVLIPIEIAEWEETEIMPNKNRGGFGTTGSK